MPYLPRPRNIKNIPSIRKIAATGEMPEKFSRFNRGGQFQYRGDMERSNVGDLLKESQPARGGMPVMRGPESRTNDLLDAGRQLGMAPQRALSPNIMREVQRLGIVPQKMARTFRTSNPRLQMMQLLRRARV
jgi:hypothetical protein